jgi:CheY-specific phosphatase CheX
MANPAPITDPSGTFPEGVVACFRDAVSVVFESYLGSRPNSVEETDKSSVPEEGVIGIISFTGTMPLSLMVGLPRETAPAVAESFVGMPIPFEDPMLGDAVGELANVVAGDVSARLEKIGVNASMSLPTVARGMVEMLPAEGQPSVLIRYDASDMKFWVRVTTSN